MGIMTTTTDPHPPPWMLQAHAGALHPALATMQMACKNGIVRPGVLSRFAVVALNSGDREASDAALQLILDSNTRPNGSVCCAMLKQCDSEEALDEVLGALEAWRCRANHQVALGIVQCCNRLGLLERAHLGDQQGQHASWCPQCAS